MPRIFGYNSGKIRCRRDGNFRNLISENPYQYSILLIPLGCNGLKSVVSAKLKWQVAFPPTFQQVTRPVAQIWRILVQESAD
jgi:hypothetical protein